MGKTNKILTVIFCCLTGINAVIWPCASDTDCTAVDSFCLLDSGVCDCGSFEYVFSQDYTKCLKTSLFGDACEDSIQCNLMPSGASCKTGVCDCADGHTYVRGRCRPLNGLDQTCETDLDCYFGFDRESVTCDDKICDCAYGYYRRNGNICRRKSMEIDDACVVDTDCDTLGSDVKCISLTCQYVDENISVSSLNRTSAKLKKEVSHASDLTSPISNKSSSLEEYKGNSPLVNGLDDLSENEIEIDNSESQKVQKSREIAVQTSIDILEFKSLIPKVKNVATATVSTSAGSRRTSYYKRRLSAFRHNDESKTFSTISITDDDDDEDKKYGSSCTENGKSCSGLPHSICSNSICLCKQGYYPKNSKCFAELGEIAESADECEYTFDDLSKKCTCQKNYFHEPNLRSCRKPIQIHLSCTSNSQCSPFGVAYCHSEIPRRCTCVEYAEYDALQQMCVYKEGLGVECETNDGCLIKNSICSNRLCVCKDNFFERDGACLPGIDADCDTDADCIQENSECEALTTSSEIKDKSCQCRKGFVHFKDECLKEANELEDECVENDQCKPLLATCMEQKCTCTEEQHFKYGRCEDKKNIGDACSKAGECFIEGTPDNIECRNSVCQCKFGYQTDTEQKACIRVRPNKNSSGRPSALKIITFILIGSAFLVTSAAIKQAYY